MPISPTNKRIQMSRCGRTGCSKMIEKDSFLLYNHNPLSLGLLPAINVILEGLALTFHQNLSRKVGAQNSRILSYCGRTRHITEKVWSYGGKAGLFCCEKLFHWICWKGRRKGYLTLIFWLLRILPCSYNGRVRTANTKK